MEAMELLPMEPTSTSWRWRRRASRSARHRSCVCHKEEEPWCVVEDTVEYHRGYRTSAASTVTVMATSSVSGHGSDADEEASMRVVNVS